MGSTTRPEPVRISVVSPGYPPAIGGVESHTERVATAVASLGGDIRVLTARRGLTKRTVEHRDGLTIYWFPALRLKSMSASISLLVNVFKNRNSNRVLHVHSYHALTSLAVLVAGSSPVIFTPHYHGVGHTRLAKLLHVPYRQLARLIFRRTDAIICVSEAERRTLIDDFPICDGKTTVIPNGVDVKEIQDALPLEGEPPTVLVIGRLEPYKNILTVVHAAAKLPGPVQLVILGEGSQEPAIAHTIRQLNVEDRVRLLGGVDREVLRRWLQTSMVLVSLSDHEAFGITALEAACAGSRVVLSDIPAHREIAAKFLGDSALVTASRDPSTIAGLIAESLDHAAPQGVEIPDWSEVAEATMAIYSAVRTPHNTTLDDVGAITPEVRPA